MTNKREWSIKYHLLILVTLFTALIIGGASAVSAADNSADPAVTAIEYIPAKTDLTLSQCYDLVDGYWDMEESDLHPETTLEVYEEDVDDEFCWPGDPSDGIHAGDILIVHYDNGESRTFTANTYFDWGGGGSMEYKHVIAWFDSTHTPCDIQVEYSYDNYPPKYKNLLKVPGKYNTKVTVSYAGQQEEYGMNITVLGKRENPVKVTPKTETIPKLKAKVSGTLIGKTSTKGKTALSIGWIKTEGAAGYDIFFALCDHSGKKVVCKKVKTIKGNKTFTWTKSGLKKGTAYKAYVKAYVMKNGKKSYVRTSPMMHAYTGNGTKNYTNAKSVTIKNVKKGKLSLKKGKTFKIKAKVNKLKKNKKLMPKSHAPTLRYMTSNKKVATVNSSGKITAKGKGSCVIYVFAHNGVSKQVKVTVK